MSGDRRLEIMERLAADSSAVTARGLCVVCAEETGTTGAGIMLMMGNASRGSVCTTDAVSARIEQLQYDLGEGPCIDAVRFDVPTLEPDLAQPVIARWPAFSEAALAAGARSVFGFPLRVGSVRLGAMNLYGALAGDLTDTQYDDAIVMADIAAESVLAMQADAPEGDLADRLSAGSDFRDLVHRAAGMVAVQLDVGVDEALLRLRAHAFGNETTLQDVAEDVVARRLVLTHDERSGSPGSQPT